MRDHLRILALVSALGPLTLPLGLATSFPALAQDAGGGDAAPQQVSLTQKQIDGLLSAQTEMSAAQGQPQSDKPDPKAEAKMQAIAKKYGFSGLDQYGAVAESVGIALAGIDPETKTYVGPAAVIKKQITQVQGDKNMPAKDKAEALKQLKEALAAGDGPKPPSGNVELVGKNYDKLSQAFQGGGE